MEYTKKKFNVVYGSKKYRDNWEATFGPEKEKAQPIFDAIRDVFGRGDKELTKKDLEDFFNNIRDFDPVFHCSHHEKCSHLDGPMCNAECEMKDWTDEEWEGPWRRE